VILTAKTSSREGTPTGKIEFQEVNTTLGFASLDAAGIASFTINTLAAGVHSLTASYSGDSQFGSTVSRAITVNIANPDFAVAAAPSSATVSAGHSTQFTLTVTPAGGFASNITFSCSPVTGATCTFNPAMVTPDSRGATTTLTVTASANVSHYGLLLTNLMEPASLLAALAMFLLLASRLQKPTSNRHLLLTATALFAAVGLSLTLGGCGGYGSNMQPNRGTATINVLAQSGSISHSVPITITVQ